MDKERGMEREGWREGGQGGKNGEGRMEGGREEEGGWTRREGGEGERERWRERRGGRNDKEGEKRITIILWTDNGVKKQGVIIPSSSVAGRVV